MAALAETGTKTRSASAPKVAPPVPSSRGMGSFPTAEHRPPETGQNLLLAVGTPGCPGVSSGGLDAAHRPQAINEFRATRLGIGAEDLTRETYMGAVSAARPLKPFVAGHVEHHRVPRPVGAAPRPGRSTAWVTFSRW